MQIEDIIQLINRDSPVKIVSMEEGWHYYKEPITEHKRRYKAMKVVVENRGSVPHNAGFQVKTHYSDGTSYKGYSGGPPVTWDMDPGDRHIIVIFNTSKNARIMITQFYVSLVNKGKVGRDLEGEIVFSRDIDYQLSPGDIRNSPCFVATAVYHDTNNPNVEVFRWFRDKVLLGSESGKEFVFWYCQNGPKFANIIEKNLTLKVLAKVLLAPMACSLRILRRCRTRLLT